MTNIVNSVEVPFVYTSGSNQANATGDGTVFTSIANSIVQGSDYNTTSGVFTARVGGIYLFMLRFYCSNLSISASLCSYNLITTLATYNFGEYNVGAWRSQALLAQFAGYIIAPMDTGDTATVTVQVSNTTKTIGSTPSFTAKRLF